MAGERPHHASDSSIHLPLLAPQTRARWISNFPPELLTHIFAYLALGPRRHGQCYAFSQVCAHWRHVALAAPGLWVCPNFSLPGLVETTLARAGTMPLDVRIKLPVHVKRSTESAIKSVLEHWSSTRTLSVKCQTLNFLTLAKPFVFRSVSQLQALRLTLRNDEMTAVPCVFPPVPLEEFAPKLRFLSLSGCAVLWGRLASSALTKVVVSLCSDDGATGLFEALKDISSLQAIEIASPFPEWTATDSPGLSVTMPNLSLMKFTGPPDGCYAFARRLKLPLECRVEFDCSYSTRIAEDEDIIATGCLAVDAYMAARDASPLHCITVEYHDYRTDLVTLAFSMSPGQSPFLVFTMDMSIKISHFFGEHSEGMQGWVDHVDFLALSGSIDKTHRHITDDNPVNVLSEGPGQVHTLILDGESAFAGFVASLCQFMDEAEILLSYFDRLSTIVLRSLSIGSMDYFFDRFVFVLESRAQAQGELFGALHFEICHGFRLMEGYLSRLKEAVSTIEGWGDETTSVSELGNGEQSCTSILKGSDGDWESDATAESADHDEINSESEEEDSDDEEEGSDEDEDEDEDEDGEDSDDDTADDDEDA